MVEGALVRLRVPRPDDAELFYVWFNDVEATAGVGLRYPIPRRAEREWVERAVARSPDTVRFTVETHAGRVLGNCGLYHVEQDNRRAELGIALADRTQWGKGYGTDAVRALCRFGFERMRLHRIDLLVFGWHAAARRVYEKVGFRVEGVARQAHWGDGAWYDDVHMSLLEGELR